jgi:hypothetical protein
LLFRPLGRQQLLLYLHFCYFAFPAASICHKLLVGSRLPSLKLNDACLSILSSPPQRLFLREWTLIFIFFIFGGSGESRRYILYQDKSSFFPGEGKTVCVCICVCICICIYILRCTSETRRARFSFPLTPTYCPALVPKTWYGAAGIAGTDDDGDGVWWCFESEEAGYD